MKLKEKNLVCCDENDEVISVNDSGISQFLERKNQLKKSFVKNSIFLLALIIISIIPIFEIITHGLFLNSYSDNDETYKFYLSTYKVVEIDFRFKRTYSEFPQTVLFLFKWHTTS